MIRKIINKIDHVHREGLNELLSPLRQEDDPTKCDNCGKKFGFFYYTVRLASYYKVIHGSFVNKNKQSYLEFEIQCKKCGKYNYRERVK